MNITQESDYAIRVVLLLSKSNSIIDAKTMAEVGSIPLRFLLKLCRKLSSAKIIKSHRGASGGYELNLPSKDITLRMVIEAIDGPIAINRCLFDPASCSAKKEGKCCVHSALEKVQKTLIDELDSINFEQLKYQQW